MNLKSILLTSTLILTGTVGYWYYGGSKPLSAEEVSRYIETIEAQAQSPGGRHNISELRAFLESDDGKPFYTVNLYRFYDQAVYEKGEPSIEVTGREAFDRFSSVMIRLMAQHASHPIFGSDWAHAGSSDWDRIVIVRYRSRRDIVGIFASDEFAGATAHKWAGLQKNGRMLVQGLHIPELFLPLMLLLLSTPLLVLSLMIGRLRRAS